MTRADKTVWFINNLTLCDEYLGQPMLLRDWQEDKIIRPLNAVRPDGKLKIRRCLLMLPRKQAKTQLSACVATEHILNTTKGGLSAICCASDRNQAGHLYKKVKTIIEADKYLSSQCRIYNSTKIIETKTGNKLQVLSSDGKRAHGENPSLVILDEVWTQKNRDLYDALTSGFAGRTEYLTLLISTQGNRMDSLIYQEYEYACKVRDGLIDDPEYLPIIFEAKDEQGKQLDWQLESTWFTAMPALGDFASLDFIRSEYKKAKEIPSEESKFRQFYLNELVASEAKWINRAKWAECGKHTFDPKELVGKPCYVGFDGSWVSDITALVLVFPWDDGTFRVLPHFWIPEKYALERDKKSHTTYRQWWKSGFINFTDGYEIDFPQLESDIPKILEPYKVKGILADPHGATSTLQRLVSAGLPVQKHRQGWVSMSSPIKYTEVLISKGQLHHNNNPVLNWMADNVIAHRDKQDNMTFDKRNSAEKIDGIVAMTMGVSGCMLATTKKPSVYEKRGLLSL